MLLSLGSVTRQLNLYLSSINTSNLLPIPPQSSINVGRGFGVNSLQKNGILNDGNNCCLSGLILCLHRINLKEYFPDPNLLAQTREFATLMLLRVLQALPSRQAFSVQMFIHVWNLGNTVYKIGQYEDISSLSEGVLNHIPLHCPGPAPVITEFHAMYTCHSCGHSADNVSNWLAKQFTSVPIITLEDSNIPVMIGQKLTSMLHLAVPINCANCSRNTFGRYKVNRGKFTIIRFNRYVTHSTVSRTRLSTGRSPAVGEQYLGQLVSCVSHTPGHYFSYHLVNGQWWKNNDDRAVQQVNFHPFNSPDPNESVNFVVFCNS